MSSKSEWHLNVINKKDKTKRIADQPLGIDKVAAIAKAKQMTLGIDPDKYYITLLRTEIIVIS